MENHRIQHFPIAEFSTGSRRDTGLGKLHHMNQFLPNADEGMISVEISTYNNMSSNSATEK